MSADESHSAKVKAGMELSRQHKAGEHVEFHKECARCRAEAKERGKSPAYPPRPDTTGDVSLGDISAAGTITIPPPPDAVPSVTMQGPVIPTTENTVPKPSMQSSETPPAPPMPEAERTLVYPPDPPKDEQEKEKQHQVAISAAQDANREASLAIAPISGKPGEVGGDKDYDILVHILSDGLTVLGNVWYRGQEIGIKRGSNVDKLSTDITGHHWYDLSPAEQMQKWGEQKFGLGPWPYEKTTESSEEEYMAALASGDVEAVRQYEKTHLRGRMPNAPVATR